MCYSGTYKSRTDITCQLRYEIKWYVFKDPFKKNDDLTQFNYLEGFASNFDFLFTKIYSYGSKWW